MPIAAAAKRFEILDAATSLEDLQGLPKVARIECRPRGSLPSALSPLHGGRSSRRMTLSAFVAVDELVYTRLNIRLSNFEYEVPLYVKDPEVDRMAERLASLRRLSKTEVVRQALQRELEREEGKPSLVEKGVAFVQALKARVQPAEARAADKAFIDSLYDRS